MSVAVHRALADPSRERIVAELGSGPLDAAQLARRVGLHANTVRWHLGVLAEAGLVDSAPDGRHAPGRPRILYRLREGTESGREDYSLLAAILASSLDAEGGPERAEQAGEAWGRYLVERPAPFSRVGREGALARVERLLGEQGFDPEREGEQLAMRCCPFRDLAEAHGRVVCGVHRGLIRGALAELGAPSEVELRPFVEPSRCLAEIRAR